jgi:hypothetical protein
MSQAYPEKLYKYRKGSDQDLEALSNDYIWSADLESLNDPFEGRVCLTELDLVDRLITACTNNPNLSLRTTVANFVNTCRRFGICSFSFSHLLPRYWAHYAANYEGYCVEYEVARLLLAQSLRLELLLPVDYVSQPPTVGYNAVLLGSNKTTQAERRLTQMIVASKRTDWQPEGGEWRLVTGRPGRKNYDFRAVTSVYLGYKMSSEMREEILTRLEGRGISFYEVSPSTDSYDLTATPISVPATSGSKYLYSIAPMARSLPELDEETAADPRLIELRRMAIEVVRRDPYCSLIYNAFLSPDSTPAAPIVVVTYKGPNNLPENMNLSAAQIEEQYSRLDDVECA